MARRVDEVKGPILPFHGYTSGLNSDSALSFSGKKICCSATSIDRTRDRDVLRIEKDRLGQGSLAGIWVCMMKMTNVSEKLRANMSNEGNIPDFGGVNLGLGCESSAETDEADKHSCAAFLKRTISPSFMLDDQRQ
jgi:hypothetical protein